MSELLEPTATEAPVGGGSAPFAGRVPPGGGSLRHRTARGTIVNALFLIGVNSLMVVKGFVVASLIATTEYGVWGILAVTLGTLMWIKRAAVGGKYIQQSEPDQELAFQKAFTFEVVVTAAATALLLLAMPLVVLVYGQNELLVPGLCLALLLPATALTAPSWIFYRRMQFVKQRVLQAFDPVVGFIVAVSLAVAGAGYWSLVAGMVLGAWAAALAALAVTPYRLAFRYDRASVREYFDFSWPLVIASLGAIVLAQGSAIAGEAALGLAGVGAIALASTISLYADRVGAIVTETLYPAICAVQDRKDLLFEAFVKSNRLTLMWAVPFGGALALFAPDLVEFGIGDKWEPAVILLQTFGLTAAAGHVGYNWHAFYRARGDTRPMAVVAVVGAITFLVAAVPLLFAYDLPGFAAGMAIVTAALLAARTVYIVRLFPAFSFHRHFARAVAPSLPPVALVAVLRFLESGERTLGWALVELALYLGVTALATLLIERRLLREVARYLRRERTVVLEAAQ